MRTTIKILIIIIICATSILAQTATPKINQIQKQQQRRIVHGIKNGDLTRGEVNKLEKQQRKVRKDKRIAKSDGVVTAKEHKHIRREQVQASNEIYKARHNKQERK